MALTLGNIPFAMSNEARLKSRRRWRIITLIIVSIICVYLDFAIYPNVTPPIGSPRMWFGLAAPWAMMGVVLIFNWAIDYFLGDDLEPRSVMIDEAGVHTHKGRFHVDYGWDQLKSAKYTRAVVDTSRGKMVVYFIELNRYGNSLQGILEGGDLIRDEYKEYRGARLSEVAELINLGIAQWGAKVR